MQNRKQEILAELDKINELERVIERRISTESFPAYDKSLTTLSEQNINMRITRLAAELATTLGDIRPLLISIMDGAMPFAQKLNQALKNINYEYQYTTMQVSSYKGVQSTGVVTIKAEPKIAVGGRTVILVDDVCDTGRTGKALKDLFTKRGALNIQLITLVNKVQPRKDGCDPDYSGFQLSKEDFIIGMGLDYDGGLRNLPYINTVNPSSLPSGAEQCILDKKLSLNEELQQIIQKESLHNEAPNTGSFFSSNQFLPTPTEIERPHLKQ